MPEQLLNMPTNELLVAGAIGMAAGFIANILLGGGGGLMRYLIAGMIGGFVAPIVLDYLGIENLMMSILGIFGGTLPENLPISADILSQIVDSTFGAMGVIILARFLSGRGG